MGKKFTFYILSNSGEPVRQTTFSKKSLIFMFLFLFALTGFVGYSTVDYIFLKYTNQNPYTLQQQVKDYQSELEMQRIQIKKYAGEINLLKSKLVGLNDFEKKLRIIANIEKSDVQNNLFGIGGSMPEDLDTSILPSERHSSLLREMNDQVDEIDAALGRQEDGFTELYAFIEEQKNILASTPAIRPTKGWFSSGFGYRTSPFTGRRTFHKGLDIANKTHTPIIASADGVVAFAGKKGGMGLMIKIDHGHGMATRYGHLSKINVKRGEAVERGDVIGLMGNTGRSTGPHLHYEVRLNGVAVNPIKYILD